MISIEKLLGYLEGRLVELEKHDPEPVAAYVIHEIIGYIKGNDN